MKEYMLLYRGGDPKWADQPKAVLDTIMEKWGAWMGELQKNDQLVNGGSPLNYDGKRIGKDGVVTDIAASELKELVSGYSIVRAKNYNDAVTLAKKCPVLADPSVIVEVREVTQMG